MDHVRVTQILSAARQRTDPDDYPELPALRHAHGLPQRGVGSGRHVRYLSQQEVDLLLGHEAGRGVYRRLEAARIPNPSPEVIRGVAKVLRLREHEWNELHIALYGHKAPKPLDPQAGQAVTCNWQRVIEQHPAPAYISNFGWDVIVYNRQADALFGPMPGNIMRWMVSLPPHQNSRSRMPDWEQTWLPVALSQLRGAVQVQQNNETLRQIEAEVLADEHLAALYRSNLDPYLHPDGSRRLMYHPGERRTGVMNAAAAEPMGSPGARVVFVMWAPLDSERERPLARRVESPGVCGGA
ncbi:MmyB family transcriptional regulator [Streptomyces venezuelae]|uniref:MmyB family transcriptional regulator n=1 Tax=Streptomyces venezuelae TaxID=54571 RepID=UPI003436F82C